MLGTDVNGKTVATGAKASKRWTAREVESWSTVETVGPARAKAHLALNIANRRLDQKWLDKYVSDLLGDRWSAFDPGIHIAYIDGVKQLVDGQHRLWAIVQSGREIPMRVTIYPEWVDGRAVQESCGTAKGRTMLDVITLTHGSRKYDVAIRGLVPRVLAWKKGNRVLGQSMGSMFTVPEINKAFGELYDDVLPWVELGDRTAHKVGVSKTAFHFAAWLLGEISATHCEEFMSYLGSGEDMRAGSPILEVRNKLAKLDQKTKRDTRIVIGLLITAWNHWCDGNTVATIRIPSYKGLKGNDIRGWKELPEPQTPDM